MITSVQEHDQVHLTLVITVVFFKEFLDFLNHFIEVHHLLVNASIDVDAFVEISEDESLAVEDLLSGNSELGLSSLYELLFKPLAFLEFDQTISENTGVLVNPKSHESHGCGDLLLVSINDTLVDTGNISKVEKVMLLGRGRLEGSIEHLVVDLKLSFNEGIEAVSYFLNEGGVEGRSDSFIDSSNSFILEVGESQDVEVSL
jgi:hypothetical protein